jgi:hypothetical protein
LSSAAHPPPVEIAPGDPAQEKEVHPHVAASSPRRQVLVVAVPVLPLVVETAGSRIP